MILKKKNFNHGFHGLHGFLWAAQAGVERENFLDRMDVKKREVRSQKSEVRSQKLKGNCGGFLLKSYVDRGRAKLYNWRESDAENFYH